MYNVELGREVYKKYTNKSLVHQIIWHENDNIHNNSNNIWKLRKVQMAS